MRNKIISAMMVLTLLLSTIVVMEKAEATTPGNDEWGIATSELFYDDDSYVDIEINTSSLDIASYYVLYPVYGDGIITWKKVKAGGSPVMLNVDDNSFDATESLSSSILLNVSGMWVLTKFGIFDGSYLPDYFWVNSTQQYEIELTEIEVTYDENQDITITVTDGNTSVACWMDLIREQDESKIFHRYEPDGVYTFNTELLEWAGNYTIQAYRDIDNQHEHGYDTGKGYYDDEYGMGIGFTFYNYSTCGPWDPPEYMAENQQIISKTKEPQASLDKNKVYWSFDNELNITLTDFNETLSVYVTNTEDENVTDYLDIFVTEEYIRINNTAEANATTGGWGRDGTGKGYGENGTWHICLFLDIDGDGTEEWNTTIDFKVLSAEGIQWFWISDNEIPEIPEIVDQPLEIKFQIIGDDHSFYGDGVADPVAVFGKNITISGNSLFTGKLSKVPGVSYSNGIWTVLLTPIMTSSDRKITFNVDWKGYGTLTESLEVGGTDLNGTIVEISPTSFVIDEDVTLSVSVFGPDGVYPVRTANVELYWLDENAVHGTLINETNTPAGTGNVYSFLFNTTEQHEGTVSVPRNIMAYAYVENMGCGYAVTEMKPKSDLRVNISKDILMAGEKTEFDINVFVGNGSSQPEEADGIAFELYDSDGDLVILNESFGSIRDFDLDAVTNSLDDYILIPGTYTIYVHNNTHDSTGHNATLIVKGVDISCDVSPFIWKYDENISAMFTIQYEGQLINGTLRIYNIKDEGHYYSTWVDTEDNALVFDVVNGEVQIDNITANKLPIDVAKENITFKFKPKTSGSAFAKVDDMVQVRIADVSVFPSFLAYNQPAKVEITVTGRGNLLDNVLVGIEVPGIAGIMDSKTNTNGKVTFAFIPLVTGNIKIFIEERESDEVIEITSWVLKIAVDLQIKEDTIFTVIVNNGDGQRENDVLVTFDGKLQTTGTGGLVTFTAPKVTSDRSYKIKVSKEGFNPDEVTVTILNVPRLMIIIDISEITAGKTFDVTVADDEGKAVIGAIIKFNSLNYTTGANGLATLTAPSAEGDYNIESTFMDYVNADVVSIHVNPVKTPGFEIIIFIASLGIALILLRKRK